MSKKTTRRSNAGKTYPAEILGPGEVQELLASCPSDPAGLRVGALIALLYRTGAEIGETLDVTLADVSLAEGEESIHFHGTRLLPRTLALDELALEFLLRWLATRRQYGGEHLFCSYLSPGAGGRWDEGDARRKLRQMGTQVLGRRVAPAIFRYTLTAELMLEQWPITHIQTQLGLSSFRSFTEILPKLGIHPASEVEVREIARTRPRPLQ